MCAKVRRREEEKSLRVVEEFPILEDDFILPFNSHEAWRGLK